MLKLLTKVQRDEINDEVLLMVSENLLAWGKVVFDDEPDDPPERYNRKSVPTPHHMQSVQSSPS